MYCESLHETTLRKSAGGIVSRAVVSVTKFLQRMKKST
jgi:hypothetical protein